MANGAERGHIVTRWTGIEVRALRVHALRRTQEELAELTGFSVNTIGKWERRGLTITLAGQFAAGMDTLLQRLDRDDRDRFEAALIDAASAAGSVDLVHALEEDDTKRRDFLAAAELAGEELFQFRMRSGEVPGAQRDPHGRLIDTPGPPSHMMDRTIRNFRAVTGMLASQRQNIAPEALLNLIAVQRDSVAALYRKSVSPSTRYEFGVLLGETSITASRFWSAVGNRPMALASCVFARRLADDELDSPGLGAMARLFESNLRSDAASLIGDEGDIGHGLRLLAEAQNAEHALSPAARARLAAEQAQAYAVLALRNECHQALARAHRAVESIGDADRTGLFSDWDATRLRVYEGTCWLFLDEPSRAVTVLREVVDGASDAGSSVALAASVDLASAHVAAGDLEEGCRLLGDTYAGLAALGNRRGVDRARNARRRLDHWRTDISVRELDDRIAVLDEQLVFAG